MLYKFKSKASGDVIMNGPHGDELLRLLGREPAAKGIVQHADLPARTRRDASASACGSGPGRWCR